MRRFQSLSGLRPRRVPIREFAMPSRAPLTDTHARTVRDLRISVTDRCNLRCVYCMPTVRADLPLLVGMLSRLAPGLDLALTTNGLKLVEMAPALRDAGLTRVNVSLDTLQPE